MKQQYDIDEIKERLTYFVLNSLNNDPDPTDEKLKQLISNAISEQAGSMGLTLEGKRELAVKIFNSLRRLDAIEPLMQDPTVTEIMVNGPDNIFFERDGKLYRSDIRFKDSKTLSTIISCFFANQNRPLNEANPIADLRLPDGSRANAVLPPIAPDGPIITIRKFTGIKQDIVTLIRQGFLSEEAARFLAECVKNRKTIFLCGGTGSGKTTFLNTLSSFIPRDERVVTIEDSAELNLQGIDNLVRMESRLPGPDGSGEVNIASMIRTALRMRPDRIIVGEVRGSESADMLTAMNSGHPGCKVLTHLLLHFEGFSLPHLLQVTKIYLLLNKHQNHHLD
ncbi:MAG: CpaF family protein [Clostridiales bacterium]|nr:CpaF family protein [Clostridiales bacterium]